MGIGDESDMRAHLVSETVCIPIGIRFFPVCQTAGRFNLDRDSTVQGTNDRDLEFRVYLAKHLQLQGLK
jgi:hypothetical protein